MFFVVDVIVEVFVGVVFVVVFMVVDVVVVVLVFEVLVVVIFFVILVVDMQLVLVVDLVLVFVVFVVVVFVVVLFVVVELIVFVVVFVLFVLVIVLLLFEQVIEWVFGVCCLVDLVGWLVIQGDLLIGVCQGIMLVYLVVLLVVLFVQDIYLLCSWCECEVWQKVWFKVVLGYGQCLDFIVWMGDIWVCLLEGCDVDSMFYLVLVLFICVDQVVNWDEYGVELVCVLVGDCCEVYVGQCVYQVRGDVVLRDVIVDVMLVMFLVMDVDCVCQLLCEGWISLDYSKLQYGLVMCWFVQYLELVQKGSLCVYSDWNCEYIVFVVWIGDCFELCEKVVWVQWFCDLVVFGDCVCGGFLDFGLDLFVMVGVFVLMVVFSF